MEIFVNEKEVIIKKEDYYKQQEISYFAWVIAYELLTKINLKGITECDKLYDFANYVSTNFVNNSEEYLEVKYSSYDMFYIYIRNKGGLQKMFDYYFEKERISYDK